MWEWAEAERYIGKEVSAMPGKYRVDTAPYQREPQEAFTDQSVQSVVLMWASRLGKTEIIQNLIGQQMCCNPRNILFTYPTLDSAKKSSRQFFEPMIQSSPALRGKIREARARDSGNTILSKKYPGGTISWIGANSPSGFRQIQAPVVLCDEIDAMENGPEGDPVTLAFKRAENYRDGIQVVSSTPTIKGASRIEARYVQSDQRKWFIPCPHCGTHWVLAWKDVIWENDPEEAYIVCPTCGGKLDDAQRETAVRSGEWRATADFHGIRGYWLNGLNSLFPPKKGFSSKLHQFAKEFLDAKHESEESLQVWINTFLAETYEVGGETMRSEDLLSRLEDYATDPLPEGVLVLTAAADVQKDRIEAEIIGWGEGEESWGIETVRLIGDTEQSSVWEKLYQFFTQEFNHPLGVRMGVKVACIDSGFATKQCYAFCEKSGKEWYPVKGAADRLRELVQTPSRRSRSRAWMVDGTAFKNSIFAWLKNKLPGPRFMHFPRKSGYDDEFFAQLTAEKRVVSFKKGQPVYTWENVRSNKRNEALDIRVYNHAACYILRPQWGAIRANLEAQAKLTKTNTKPDAPRQPIRQPSVRGGWISGWK